MAKKITELPAASQVAGTDLLVVVDTSTQTTKKAAPGLLSSVLSPGGSLVGTTATQTVTNKTLDAPKVTTGSTFLGTRVNEYSNVSEIQMATTANTLIWSFAMTNETVVYVDICVTVASRTSVTKAAALKRAFAFVRSSASPSGGVAYQVGTTESGTDKLYNSDSFALTITSSGTSIQVYGQAPDTTSRNVTVFARVQEQLST